MGSPASKTKRLLKLSFVIVCSSAGLGLAIGLGWALWGDIKGQHLAVIVISVVVGTILGLPVTACFIIDSWLNRLSRKILTALLPLFVLSFCVPYYGGLVMFLQLSAILFPTFVPVRWWSALLVSLIAGFAFLWLWFLLRTNHLAPIRSSDDIFVFYPFAIVVVSLSACVAKALKRTYVDVGS
ncbi:MAG: hypothetical protein QGF00_03455 [Planctomycetota bacterium]|jgi:hypothetical protein|nr:hypothetical protein [Planctomycetota bacterium]MDP7248634.1 hypothetical protein [Planctomycetota bacterium]